MHVDMNAYFASVEQASNPFLRGKPIAVGGGVSGKRGIVAAASYEAKARGIKTAMPAWEALKLCPELIIVPGDMDKYIYTSCEIMDILREFTPLVEVFSIDEAFMDVTNTEQHFGGVINIAKSIKRKIRERFHLTCSIGIGPNKLLAKLAGELKKPDGLLEIYLEDFPGTIKDTPVAKLCGVGRKIEKYLAELRINTLGDLNSYPRERLVKRFGTVCGEHLWQMGQGKDNSPVAPSEREVFAKSMGHSHTLPKATQDIDEVKGYLLRLSEQVGRRLRQGGYRGNVVHTALGFSDLKFWGKQKKVADYLDDGYEIYQVAEKLLHPQITPHNQTHSHPPHPTPIRFVSVSVTNFIHNIDQISLLPENEARKKVSKAVDTINDRYGESTIERAGIMQTVLHEKTGMVARNLYSSLPKPM